jgi:putative PIN family toxin of toxin-antitoxin system
MPDFDRIVVDTNVFVSALIILGSVPSQAVGKALDSGIILFSEATMTELAEVLSRPKFSRYVSVERRASLLGQLASVAEFVPVIRLVRECRDPKDDKFLEVALNGRADLIIAGDADLLRMHPWRGIAVLSPVHFLGKVKS